GVALHEALDGLDVDGSVFANGGMGATARLDADDSLFDQRAAALQEERVFLGVDVVGYDGDLEAVAHPLAEGVDERGLAGADGATHSAGQGLFLGRIGHSKVRLCCQDRKRRVYWVSWRALATPWAGARKPMSSSVTRKACSAAAGIAAAAASATMRCAAV